MKKKVLQTKATLIILLVLMLLISLTSIVNAAVYSGNIIPGSGGTASTNMTTSPYRSLESLFDGDDSTWWYPQTPPSFPTGWFQYQFLTPRTVTKFSIQGVEIPKNFNLEAYDESGNKWDVLKQVRQPVEYPGYYSSFYEDTVENTKAYTKYRISILNWFQEDNEMLFEIKMYETLTPAKTFNLTATAGNTKVDLAWSTVDKATQYTVKRSLNDANGVYEDITTVSSTNYTDNTVENGKTYYYKVSAKNTYGSGPDSDYAEAKPYWDNILSLISGESTIFTQGFNFPTNITVKKINFNLENVHNANTPTSYSIEGWDGVNWVTLPATGSVVFGTNNELTINNSTAYQTYRITLFFDRACSVKLTLSAVYGF